MLTTSPVTNGERGYVHVYLLAGQDIDQRDRAGDEPVQIDPVAALAHRLHDQFGAVLDNAVTSPRSARPPGPNGIGSKQRAVAEADVGVPAGAIVLHSQQQVGPRPRIAMGGA